MIHTFGDSHAREPWSKIKGISWNVLLDKKSNEKRVMTMTCSFFGFEKLNAINIKKYKVVDGDVVCFCLGELDCRCHIHKHKDSYKELIERIVDDYLLAIKANADQFTKLKVIIVSVTPPLSENHYKDMYGYPVLGSDIERVTYTRYMNLKIKEKCQEYGYSFLDMYDKYCDKDGLLNLVYSDKICHIINPIFAKPELNKLL